MAAWLTRQRCAALAACFLLAACGSLPATRAALDRPIARYALEGRFALRDKGQSYHGRVLWQHDAAGNRIFVQDPLGGGVAELSEDGRGAHMVQANGTITDAVDATQLMLALTGVALPVRSVATWLTGRALPSPAAERDAHGRPLVFAAEGWTIRYEYPAAGPGDADLLPSRVFAANSTGIDLRLAIDGWTLEPAP